MPYLKTIKAKCNIRMKSLLFTGGTGFLGYNCRPILDQHYAVTTCGITEADEIRANLAKEVPTLPYRYDVVLHACGKAHVIPKTEEEKQQFYDINYQGTINLCKALEKVGVPKAFIFISTASVYGLDKGEMISEDYPLKADTPYGKSKVMAEEFLQTWCKENNIILTVLRPSLMAGKNAPGNLGAMVNGIKKGYYVNIAGGKARKSLMMAEDIAKLVILSEDKGGIYNVCDDIHPSYKELSELIAKQLGKRTPISIPYWMAWCLAKVGDCLGKKAPINSYRLDKLTTSITLSNEKAKRDLSWQPSNVLKCFIINS